MSMTQKSYRIKPLEWKGDPPKLEGDRVQCDTVFGSMWVGFPYLYHSGEEYLLGTEWRWGYCFNEYCDEGEMPCDSLQHGQQLAQEHYERRLLAALEPVEDA